jgi:prepilin-type N-terminal cleavage/methylation domain-containing protein
MRRPTPSGPAQPRRGFTLIEIIVSMVILSLLVAVAGLGFVEMARGYIFTREVAEATHKSQLVLARMTMELRRMDAVTSATANQITYSRFDGTSQVTYTVSYASASDTISMSTGGGAARPLMNGVGTYEAGRDFLEYLQDDGSGSLTTWVPADGLENLAVVTVRVPYDFSLGGQTVTFETDVNPRNSGRVLFPEPKEL